MEGVRLDHCVVTVSDWERSNTFYRDVLGAELVPVNGGWMYRFGDAQLNPHGPGGEYEPNATVPVPAGGSDLCFRWPGLSRGRSSTWRCVGSRWSWGRLRASGREVGAPASTSAIPTARRWSLSRIGRDLGPLKHA